MTALRLAALPLAAALAGSLPAAAQTAPEQERPAPAAPAADAMVPKGRQDKVFELGATWVAMSLNGKPFSGERPSFSIDQQYRLRGFGGCNVVSATAYPLREQRLSVGPLLFTKKGCEKAILDAERSYFVALRNAQQWDMQGVQLVVKSQAGELRFERAL